MELKENNIYIFRMRFYPNSVKKLKIDDLTDTSIQYSDMDTGTSKRELRSDFEDEWKIIETVFDWENWHEELTKAWKGQPQQLYFTAEEDSLVPYFEICGCNPKNGGNGICGCVMGDKMVRRGTNMYNSSNTSPNLCYCTGECYKKGKCPNSLN